MAATTATPAVGNGNTNSSKQPSYAELKEMVAALELRNRELAAKASAPRKVTMKVSEKGAISVYGLGRLPVTLYASQWSALVEYVVGVDPSAYDTTIIGKFVAENRDKLAFKE